MKNQGFSEEINKFIPHCWDGISLIDEQKKMS